MMTVSVFFFREAIKIVWDKMKKGICLIVTLHFSEVIVYIETFSNFLFIISFSFQFVFSVLNLVFFSLLSAVELSVIATY